MVNTDLRVGHVTFSTERAGTPVELSQLLLDFEAAYLALYRIDSRPGQWRGPRRHMMFEYAMEFGFPPGQLGWPNSCGGSDSILPEHQLLVTKVRIESPGFWEFLGSLNPLLQIREYLNDRHRRRQDKDFREASERDRLMFENEILQRQIIEKDNTILRERISILKEIGVSDQEIREKLWASIGKPLAQLGRHQDSRLIGGPPEKHETPESIQSR